MGLFSYLRNFIKKPNKEDLLLDTPKNLYSDLIESEKIDRIISNMPKNLSDIEKAYYIYIELGKILKENAKFVLGDINIKKNHYNDKIDLDYSGICKSISQLYANVLGNKHIGIKATPVIAQPGSSFSHVDTILTIDGKNYICNLISDLSNIKTSKRINSFCYDMNHNVIQEDYLKRLENHFGKIDFLSRDYLENLDRKLEYSYCDKSNSKRSLYTNDLVNMLQSELNDPKTFKEFILNNKEVPKEEVLKYKLDYIFKNINKFTHYNDKLDYLENIKYLLYVAKKIITRDENPMERIQSYIVTQNNDFENLVSILKINTFDKTHPNNKSFYYLYSKELQTFIEKTPEEMIDFINTLDKSSLKIIGTYDMSDDSLKDKDLNEELEL